MKKYLITLATIVTLILLNSNCIEASYDRNKASDYAQKYSQDPNTYFYTFGSDCTNFVSQCEAVAGVVSVVPRTFPSAPGLFSGTKVDSNQNVWYMVHRKRSVGKNYFIYSKTWSCVTDFRNYFSKSNNRGSNNIATVRTYSRSNWTSAKNNMKIGDVVQYDQNGKRHSVIITQKSGSVVRYCAHTSNRKNENINTFYNYMVNNGITNFYVISFS